MSGVCPCATFWSAICRGLRPLHCRSLMAVSSWNDNGQEQFVSDPGTALAPRSPALFDRHTHVRTQACSRAGGSGSHFTNPLHPCK